VQALVSAQSISKRRGTPLGIEGLRALAQEQAALRRVATLVAAGAPAQEAFAAADQARQRIERDLHDGTQQRLVSLGLAARIAQASVPAGQDDLRAEVSRIAAGLADAVAELQEFSRGIHPAVLSERGLGPALRTLARRSTVPVELDVTAGARFPGPVEIAAYYVASEALANVMKRPGGRLTTSVPRSAAPGCSASRQVPRHRGAHCG
jgi:signal transduction histidine kinase